jgi:phosphatidylethanolamine-binding protein (PEBP) family uncharacterized protein
VVPALVAAVVLAVSGCGGGSDAKTASTPSSTTSAEGSAGATTGASGSSRSSSSGAAAGSKPSSPASTTSQGSGKQGPHIKPPKGAPERAATPAEQAEATVADIALASPVLGPAAGSAAALPSSYTCDGKDSWPQLRWQGVPPDTKELALFAMNVQPVQGKLFFDWAVAGIEPGLEGIEAGRLPKGAVSGRNSFGRTGYSICPPAGQAETYVFALFALPKRLPASQGFDPRALREAILEVSGNAGLLAASYARG